MSQLYFINRLDCEATQPAIGDAALGRRATTGFVEVLEAHGLKGSFFAIPSEVTANADLYRELAERGHEIGLHLHPADQGYAEFLGVYGAEDQRRIIDEAGQTFAAAVGYLPSGICIGYGSSNDHTFGVVHALGYRHGVTMVTGRILPACASVAAGAPLDVHYAHRYNRVLPGDLDFVELPKTIDPNSRMWGGCHPQDLRVELVDAKNHYYVIRQAIERQLRDAVPLPLLHANSHNLFEYSDTDNFRRQTLVGMIEHTFALAAEHGLTVVGATCAEVAAAFRAVQSPAAAALELDRRGHR